MRSEVFYLTNLSPRILFSILIHEEVKIYQKILCTTEASPEPFVSTGAVDYDSDDEEEETIAQKLDRIFCSWSCPPVWNKFANLCFLFICDPVMELFITLCIVLNTLFMAMDYHGKSEHMTYVLQQGNYVSTFSTFLHDVTLYFYSLVK